MLNITFKMIVSELSAIEPLCQSSVMLVNAFNMAYGRDVKDSRGEKYFSVENKN